MDLIIAIVLLFGITIGLWYVWHASKDLYRNQLRTYRCLCGKHELAGPDEHYDDPQVYHGVQLCQPHREMITGQRKPPRR